MYFGFVALKRSGLVVLVSGLLALAGCSGGSIAGLNGGLNQVVAPVPASKKPGVKLTGSVHGGQFPIAYANIYLFQANTAGYGSPSLSLLASAPDTILDASSGATNGDNYVMTDGSGNFSISLGDYTCSQNSQVYLYTLGGDPGLGTGVNPAAGLMAVLGNCPVAGNFSGTSVAINEVSTVSAAYAMAGFATDALHVSSSGTPLALTGIANAFANAGNLASMGTGLALTATPAGNAAVPQAEINTMANILATCINSDGGMAGPTNPSACYTLFTSALSGGTTGTQPADTATAAIYFAHNPGANVASLFGLLPSNPPFLPVLAVQPNDFTVALTFTGGGLDQPNIVAIDGAGDAWITSQDSSAASVIEIASANAPVAGTSSYTGGGLNAPWGVAIDLSGNAWVTNNSGNSVTELSSSGSILSGLSGYRSALMSGPTGIAIDASGNAWIANTGTNTVAELSSTGGDSSGPEGFFSNDMSGPIAIAIDDPGNAWIANTGGASVTELSDWGTLSSGAGGFTGGGIYAATSIAIDSSGDAWVAGPYSDGSQDPGGVTELSSAGAVVSSPTGGGMRYPRTIAIDGAGNAWVGDSFSNVIAFSNSGSALSGANGYLTPTVNSIAAGVAIDGSGDVWIAFPQSNAVVELVGAGTPVVTPLAVGVQNKTLGMQP
jgi:hypothetical protein